jgi:8-oxo-dGTP diphosphatase
MKILAEISEGTLGLGGYEQLGGSYKLEKSARAILLNAEGAMAVQFLQTYAFHKLPGGGVETGETVEQALKREVVEEVGCECDIVRDVGMTIEYRNKYNLLYISYCFVARVVGEIGEPQLEDGEVEEGQTTLWLAPHDVLEKMSKDTPKKSEGHFILKREMSFLEEYLRKKRSAIFL